MDAAALIASWETKLGVVMRNVTELAEAEFTKRIRNRLREGQFTGVSRVQAQSAMTGLSRLSDDYLLLGELIGRARALKPGGLIAALENRNIQVEALFASASIRRVTGALDIGHRDLMSGSITEQTVTPADLLADMQGLFTAARDSLLAIDSADQAAQARMVRLKAEYADWTARAATAGCGDPPPFIKPEAIAQDPLGAAQCLDSMERNLAAWARAVAASEAQTRAAQAALAGVRGRLAQLADLLAANIVLAARLRADLGEGVVAQDAQPADLMPSLGQWADRVEQSLRQGQVRAAELGLGHLGQAIDGVLAREQDFATRGAQALARASDLAGRFDALRAKARSDPTPAGEAIKTEIRVAFARRPLPLGAIEALLVSYSRSMTTSD